MNQMVRFGMILGIICLAATLVLAVTYEITRPKIEEQMRLEEEKALKAIMPDADSFKAKTAGEIEYYDALKDGSLIGYCVKAEGQGYGGRIRMVVGISPEGVIKGVEVLEHQETPGLGSKINEIRPGDGEPYFLKQFKGKQAGSIAIKKDIDAITGATISSKAVTDGVRMTVSDFLKKVSE